LRAIGKNRVTARFGVSGSVAGMTAKNDLSVSSIPLVTINALLITDGLLMKSRFADWGLWVTQGGDFST
jgi:hypothetical protein